MYVLLIQIFYWIFTEYQTQRSTGGLTDSLGLHKLVTEGFTSVIYYPKLNSNERGGKSTFCSFGQSHGSGGNIVENYNSVRMMSGI